MCTPKISTLGALERGMANGHLLTNEKPGFCYGIKGGHQLKNAHAYVRRECRTQDFVIQTPLDMYLKNLRKIFRNFSTKKLN